MALIEAKLGRPRRRVEAVETRLKKTVEKLGTLQEALAKEMARAVQRPAWREELQRRIEQHQQEVVRLQARLKELAADNATNPNPRRILLRMDGAFGDGEDVGWLYELGYDVVVRAYSHRTADSLRAEGGLAFEKVTKNESIAEAKRTEVGKCAYPMRLFACRQLRGEEGERWTVLIVNPELGPKEWPGRRVGVFYNGRQVIEATIKEGKGVFSSRHLPSRHKEGIEIYQELVLLAQNLVRWFRGQCLGGTKLAGAGVKELVRIAANSRAAVLRQGEATAIRFVSDSPWRGITLWMQDQFSYQLWFPFLEDQSHARAVP